MMLTHKYLDTFEILVNRNMCSCYVSLIINMYATEKLRVKWGDIISLDFNCLDGVKQLWWCPISNIFMCIHFCQNYITVLVFDILGNNSWAVCTMQMILYLSHQIYGPIFFKNVVNHISTHT
jgi:hypothetical protein